MSKTFFFFCAFTDHPTARLPKEKEIALLTGASLIHKLLYFLPQRNERATVTNDIRT